MVRQRKAPPKFLLKGQRDGPSHTRHDDEDKYCDENTKGPSKMVLPSLGVVVCLTIAFVFCFKGYFETRVNTHFDSQKMVIKSGLAVRDRYWGSYRPGVYFGMKTREPYSPVIGLMWYFPHKLLNLEGSIRHWCEQGDNLARYTWTHHDGKSFGVQEIDEEPFRLTTSFVKKPGGKHGGDWTARISVDTKEKRFEGEKISLMVYTAIEDQTNGYIEPKVFNSLVGFSGETGELGNFTIRIANLSGVLEDHSYLTTVSRGLHTLRDTIDQSLRVVRDPNSNRRKIVLPGDLAFKNKVAPNFIVSKIDVTVPFSMDVIYESESHGDRKQVLTGEVYSKELKVKKSGFDAKFETTFNLKDKGFSEQDVEDAKAIFSNLIGGIGYFYGSSRVKSVHTADPVPYWKAPLYSAVPSRSFFPRGFLWDEGFHGLLLSAWDLDVELDIMNHWFDLMNVEAWIPREQILGVEALAKVPEEFVTQINTNANPPTFFLTLKFMLKNLSERFSEEEDRLSNLKRLYPRLQAWFNWFNTSQVGSVPGSYRWRGRDSHSKELNPKSLSSGLDDYPRASHPTDDERHIDLRCWLGLAAGILAEISDLLGKSGRVYRETADYLADNKLLDELHWSQDKHRYADYGLHTDKVSLVRPPQTPDNNNQYRKKVRKVKAEPKLQFVDSSFGFISLFPLITQIIDPNSTKLEQVLKDLKREELLWTPYGLRSLAKNSPFYMAYNTEDDPPYWRGPIWININYLVVRSLRYYADLGGPYSDLSGYIWEQYNDSTGQGQRAHPFTGWSSLVVLLMAEIY
uniref:Mannosyl-oligosaccharide glucosidase n=1 Tax=Cacopsylla melanoneura TaxID=428564 RepID=A0A8D8LV22_9HEMI